MSVAPYPHIKMGVRDESIYVGLDTEIMPLDMPLYMVRSQKGPEGKPIWCPTYTYACQIFGADTFNKRSKYWSEASYFLLKTLVSNGAFIMRCVENKASTAKVFVECGIKNTDIPQWKRNTITGNFTLTDDGSKIKINSAGTECEKLDEAQTVYGESTDTAIIRGTKYFTRSYSKFDYNVIKSVKASENMVAYKGNSTTADFKSVGMNEVFADANAFYAKTVGTAKQIIVEGQETLKATEEYWKIVYKDYEPVVLAANQDISAMYGTLFERVADVTGGYKYQPLVIADSASTQYVQVDTSKGAPDKNRIYYKDSAGAELAGTNGKVTEWAASMTYYTKVDVVIGDTVDNNGDIHRPTDTEVYTAETAADPDDSKVYYTKTAAITYTLAENDGKPTTFEAGKSYYVKTVQGDNETYTPKVETEPDTSKTYYVAVPAGTYVLAGNAGKPSTFASGTVYYYKATVHTEPFIWNYGKLYVETGTIAAGEYEPQATIPGVQLCWRAVLRNSADDREVDSDEPTEATDGSGYMWYPMISIVADTKGAWGGAFGFRFFYDKGQNTLAAIQSNGAVKYTIAPVELKEDDTTPTAIVDAYGEQVVSGVMKDGVVDPTTDLEITLSKLVPQHYSGSRELPCSISYITKNFNVIGKKLMEAEIKVRNEIKALYAGADNCLDYWSKDKSGAPIIATFVDDLFNMDKATSADITEDAGYMANVVSAVAGNKVPYFASRVVGTTFEESGTANPVGGAIDMNDDSAFYLMGGTDGDISDWAIEKYQRAFIDAAVAGTQEYLIDYLRCPYNNIIDTGVSLQTKKAYLDFMGVRDNLTVFLTPQQIWCNKDGSRPAQLSQFEDESVGAALRAYGLLMREDVENATEANRCIIFLASGINSDHDWNKGNLVASTLWVALKNAEYLNKQYIDKEPVERPNSEITCYDKGMTWTAASEETRSRVWNAGLNYAQYCDQDTIHYASVRSIYRYDTSVLCDMGTVRAVTFCKDIIRREWAIWAGSKRKAEELNARITKALEDKVSTMLNNKYTATISVYQTDEDKKYGYVRHVDLELESPAQNRVWLATIICKREGFDASAED